MTVCRTFVLLHSIIILQFQFLTNSPVFKLAIHMIVIPKLFNEIPNFVGSLNFWKEAMVYIENLLGKTKNIEGGGGVDQ